MSTGLITRSGFTALIITALVAGGCGGGGGPSEPATPVLTALEVSPGAPALFSRPPGNTVTLSVVARDQNGAAMAGVTPFFTSENTAILTVNGNGIVSAVAAGTARVTVSVTSGTTTRTVAANVTVNEAAATADVTAPALVFLPSVVHIAAGGTVTWTIASIHHTVSFGATAGSPASIGELRDASASRAFTMPGSYSYSCDFHAGMTGTVHVH
ncbi:MAG TPA: plastocyanin/azurin family copper-binding protein [Longimicrobiales bacterium]